jgi:hypothetical protein
VPREGPEKKDVGLRVRRGRQVHVVGQQRQLLQLFLFKLLHLTLINGAAGPRLYLDN